MKENYSSFQNNINAYNPENKAILNNNTFSNILPKDSNKKVAYNEDSMGIEELPPMEEDIDHLKNYNLRNRNNIYHFNNLRNNNHMNQNKNSIRSYSLQTNKFNSKLMNQTQDPRKTEGFYMKKTNNLKAPFIPMKQDLNKEKPPARAINSRYNSSSENKYHFITKSSNNQSDSKLMNQTQEPRKTEGFYMKKTNNLKAPFIPIKQDLNKKKPPVRAINSRYNSASENKYHFMHKLSNDPLFVFSNNSLPLNIKGVNYAPIKPNNKNQIYSIHIKIKLWKLKKSNIILSMMNKNNKILKKTKMRNLKKFLFHYKVK